MSKDFKTFFTTTDIAAPQTNSEQFFARALSAHRAGRLEEALAAYDQSLSVTPGNVAALVNKGAALRELGRLPEAMGCYWQAVALQPSSREAWCNAGNALLDMGRDEEALAVLRVALSQAPQTAEVWLNLGTILLKRDHRAAAAACLRLALALKPDNPVAEARLDLALAKRESHPPLIPVPVPQPPAAALPRPLGTRLMVGIAWHDHPDVHGPDFEDMLPVAGVHGAAIFSLQTGPSAADAEALGHPALVLNTAEALAPADLPGTIAALDLVITANPALAHLAVALGRPAWGLVSVTGDDRLWPSEARLFRQAECDDWHGAVVRVAEELAALVAERPLSEAETADIVAYSVFPRENHHRDTEGTEKSKTREVTRHSRESGSPEKGMDPRFRGDDERGIASGRDEGSSPPRFRVTAPRAFIADPGIRFLMTKERSGIGYEYATRSFLDAHLQPGDLFIDVGAHWGIMSLQAVTRWPGDVRALAVEPSPRNLPHLKKWLADNAVEDLVEVIGAAASDAAGRGELKPESTMGHSLIKADRGAIPVVTIDGLLEGRPHLAGRRVIVKIDVEGNEPEVITGMSRLLASGRVAAVIWERGIEYGRPAGQERLRTLRAQFDALGFAAWRFDSEDQAGPMMPFLEDGRTGNVFELAAGVSPAATYGVPRPASPVQPADAAFDAALRARRFLERSRAAQTEKKTNEKKTKEALQLFGEAAALDATFPDLFNNLGVALRGLDRHAAATACYRRGLGLSPNDAVILSNLGNSLREEGHLDEARGHHANAVALAPGNASMYYNAGLVERDAGAPEEAQAFFETALSIAPDDPEYRWNRALVLLQKGDYAAGFPAYESRWGLPRATRRKVSLPLWDGEPLAGRSIFLHDEQGFGDVLQFARFIPEVKRRGAGMVAVECQPELLRLMAMAPGVDAVVPREKGIPSCDTYAPLLSLPAILGTTLETIPTEVPYLNAPQPQQDLPDDGRLKLGLVWAGKPTPRDRSIPLERLLPLLGDPRYALFSLQVGPRATDLKATGADAFVTDLGPRLFDFAETAAVLKQLDLLVTVDTAVAHLAGALGVPTFLLLRYTSDWRWFDQGTTSPWYPSFTLIRQQKPNRWEGVSKEVGSAIEMFGASSRTPA